MMKKFASFCLGLLLAMASMQTRAGMPEPDALIKDTVRDVLQIVKEDKDIKAGNQQKIIDLVDAKVLPHFNLPA